MSTRSTRQRDAEKVTTPTVVPSGAPSWVTPELIEKTVKVWQPYYEEELIPEDALAIILGAGRVFEYFAQGLHHETVRRSGSS